MENPRVETNSRLIEDVNKKVINAVYFVALDIDGIAELTTEIRKRSKEKNDYFCLLSK